MAIQLQGNAGTVAEIEAATRAARIAVRPTDIGALGSYSVMATSGTIAAGLGAASLVYAFRYTAANLALIHAVHVAVCNTTAFTAGLGYIDMIAARSYTVSETAGSTQTLYTQANSNKRRTSFAATTADIRISTTAAISGGTKTLDANALSSTRFVVPATANTNILPVYDIWAPDFAGEWPLVFVQNEGFVLRATLPTTGVWFLDVIVEWSEILTTSF